MIYSIYRVVNKINNKCYIGFTQDPKRRFFVHAYDDKNGAVALKKAINIYGVSNFRFHIIYQSKDREHTLTVMEPYFIKEYDTLKNGYNLRDGGASKQPVIHPLEEFTNTYIPKFLEFFGKPNYKKLQNSLVSAT